MLAAWCWLLRQRRDTRSSAWLQHEDMYGLMVTGHGMQVIMTGSPGIGKRLAVAIAGYHIDGITNEMAGTCRKVIGNAVN
jgi:hypothetical protein